MRRDTDERSPQPYRQPRIETLEAVKVVDSLGPVMAGGSADPCGPMLGNFCL